MDFETFYSKHRKVDEPDHSFIRATANVSNAQLKRAYAGYEKAVTAKYDERIELRKEYQSQVRHGLIQVPSRNELLIAKARGHEDLNATHAARRLLEKQGIDWRQE
jgi:hypothetical protein